MGVAPREKQEVKIKYKLPFRLNFKKKSVQEYSLYLQKQAGAQPSFISVQINLPPSLEVVWYPNTPEWARKDNQLIFKSELDQDKSFKVLLKRK
jgi:hypothetical protein